MTAQKPYFKSWDGYNGLTAVEILDESIKRRSERSIIEKYWTVPALTILAYGAHLNINLWQKKPFNAHLPRGIRYALFGAACGYLTYHGLEVYNRREYESVRDYVLRHPKDFDFGPRIKWGDAVALDEWNPVRPDSSASVQEAFHKKHPKYFGKRAAEEEAKAQAAE